MKRFLFLVLASLLISTSVPAMASANSSTSLINTARNYMGTPYSYGGTTPSGFDCSGYIQYVFNKAGQSVPRTTGQQYASGKVVSKSNLQTGDLVFFNTSGSGVSHVGIYIGSSNFIHASTSRGVMISSINDPYYWGSRYIGARRVANFTSSAVTQVSKQKAEVKYATRAEIAEILAEKLNLKNNGSESAFTDVSSNHPNSAAIVSVAAAGIFTGNSLGEFNPDDYLTRAQLAKVLVEAFNLQGKTDSSFKDVSATYWAKGYINTLYYHNITTGYGNGNFGINDKVTANQFKTFMNRIKN
ncbi:C40 family peptidase [Filibacter tadaridae]|uniref:Murein DD-endopeptidase MepS/Murein LD-carboxypeptidase n=1 Tax=Filibacter tadaridae TaxID=2483811 RepID=A0A3P5X0E4_9BACL|nr:C40 family peptidase [Filibacter tadaridae]VDC24681.1 Murein DD-endopeptidase MepS/Murein LD-carboxypeptidase precursor [Filibacter tadaridae]